jgi:hypothetical protein
MVEVLAIFGFVSWLCARLCQWVGSLSCLPALAIAVIMVPALCSFKYRRRMTQWNLSDALHQREPIPPERFYWLLLKPLLCRSMFWFTISSMVAWWNVSELFGSDVLSVILGWLNAWVAIVSTGYALSACILYFRASQWFDCMTPDLIRILRQAMYQLSDNYEFLGDRQRDPIKEEHY